MSAEERIRACRWLLNTILSAGPSGISRYEIAERWEHSSMTCISRHLSESSFHYLRNAAMDGWEVELASYKVGRVSMYYFADEVAVRRKFHQF